MSFSISKRPKGATVSTVNAFDSWFNKKQQKPSIVSYQSTKLVSSNYNSTLQNYHSTLQNYHSTLQNYHSTISVNPQINQFEQNQSSQIKMRRTYSAFRNNQSRVSVMKDGVFDLNQQIKHLQQKTKRSKLDLQMLKRDLPMELKQREKLMRQQLQNLNKIVKQTIRMNEIRTDQIKNDTMSIRSNYDVVKMNLNQLANRLSAVQHECGFMTFASKLYK